MDYLYYPGCSLTGSAREYDTATRAVLAAAGAQLTEIEDWTCCGASAAAPVSRLLALSLGARNLALAENMAPDGQILVPCSACYLNLQKARDVLRSDPDGRELINRALAAVGLKANGHVPVRHLLDVLSADLGARLFAPLMHRSLAGLTVAPYYGCQCLRPYVEFDDPERPTSMAPLIAATGADLHPWEMGARCCGAALVNTRPDDGLRRVTEILEAADGADVIVTVCPMCQMNLDAWQKKASQQAGADLSISVLYLPQLLGLAMGMSEAELGIHLNLAVLDGFREKLAM